MIDKAKKKELLEYLETQKFRDIHLQSFRTTKTGAAATLLFRFPRSYVVESRRRITAGDVSGLIYDEFVTQDFNAACKKFNELESNERNHSIIRNS